jgi:transcriptional regulator with XRE-family HTH domain
VRFVQFELLSPGEIAAELASRVRSRRLERGFTQAQLAERAGISPATLKRFEHTGRIAFVSLVRLAVVLEALPGMERIFAAPEYRTIEDVAARAQPRKRGRRS